VAAGRAFSGSCHALLLKPGLNGIAYTTRASLLSARATMDDSDKTLSRRVNNGEARNCIGDLFPVGVVRSRNSVLRCCLSIAARCCRTLDHAGAPGLYRGLAAMWQGVAQGLDLGETTIQLLSAACVLDSSVFQAVLQASQASAALLRLSSQGSCGQVWLGHAKYLQPGLLEPRQLTQDSGSYCLNANQATTAAPCRGNSLH
jgi:hypothetical protein